MCACVYAHTLYREDVEARDQFTAVSPLFSVMDRGVPLRWSGLVADASTHGVIHLLCLFFHSPHKTLN